MHQGVKLKISRIPLIGLEARLGWRYRQKFLRNPNLNEINTNGNWKNRRNCKKKSTCFACRHLPSSAPSRNFDYYASFKSWLCTRMQWPWWNARSSSVLNKLQKMHTSADFPKTVGPDRQQCSRTDDFKIYIRPNVWYNSYLRFCPKGIDRAKKQYMFTVTRPTLFFSHRP